MSVILLPLNLFLFILLIRSWLINRGQFIDWIPSVLLGATVFGLWLISVTQFLSLFKALRFYPLVVSWAILFFVLLTLNYYHKNNLWLGFKRPSFSGFQLALMGIVVFFIVVTGGIGVISAPNNWDSMTYHLPRVMHWMQNQSLAHYATSFLPQLYDPIWAEVAITHLYILTGNDQWVNWVQWVSMIGGILGVSYVARLLGANQTGQLASGVVAATIPMGILQAVTTQNDYVVAFWLVCTVVYILSFRQTGHRLYMWAMAASVALATSTKGTAYFYVAPFLIWAGIEYFRKYRGQVWQPVAMVALLMVFVNGNYYLNNIYLFGSPLVSGHDEYGYAVQTFSLSGIISNLLRNLAIHLTMPVPAIVKFVENGIIHLHVWLGISPDDPRTTWPGTQFGIPSFIINEDVSGNFFHLVLIGGVGVVLAARKKFDTLFIYGVLLLTSFILFAACLKWQPWHSRLHLPLFVLWAPLLGLMISRLRYRPLAGLVVLLLIIQAMPFLLRNPLHPVLSRQNILTLPRNHQYFLANPALEEPYHHIVTEVVRAQCSRLGLIIPVDSWEYPFWVLSKQLSPIVVQIQSLAVNNQSRTLADSTFHPCAVVCLQCQPADVDTYTQLMGAPRFSSGSDRLFIATPINR